MGVIAPGVLDGLVARVERLCDGTPDRVLIGIVGKPGGGKTTLATELARRVPAAHVPMDGFHLADSELDRLGRRDRKGAPDTFDDRGYAALLARIRAGEDVWAPGFERILEQPLAQAIYVPAETQAVVSEGNYLLLWPHVRALFTETWFVRTADSRRVDRLIARHVEYGKTPDQARAWVLRSDERNAQLVAETERLADLVVDD